MEDEGQRYVNENEEPICRRLPKRKCVTEFENIKNTIGFELDISTPPPLEKLSRSVGYSGKRRGRPPTKKRAHNYVYPTAIINLVSAMIVEGLTTCDLIDMHRRFLPKAPIITPDMVSRVVLDIKNYKQLSNKPRDPPKVPKAMPRLSTHGANPPGTWPAKPAPQVSQPYRYPQSYYQPVPTLSQNLYHNNYQNYQMGYPHTTTAAPMPNYGCSAPARNEYYYNYLANQQGMVVNSTQRAPALPQNMYNGNQYYGGKYNERTDM